MNTIIQAYRRDNPTDQSTDDQLLQAFGQMATPEVFAKYPDFAKDYQTYQTRKSVEESSVLTEFGRGVKRGVYGLEATAAGLSALASDYLGLAGARDYFKEAYRGREEKIAAEAPPSVPNIQTGFRTGPRGVAQWVAGEAGALVPNLAEAVGAGVVGGIVGSAVAPGVGTAAGAAEGFFAKQAAKAAIKRLVEKNPIVTKELEEYAAGTRVASMLSKEAEAVIDAGTRAGFKSAGAQIASGVNFALQGAGGAYGGLSQVEGVSDQAAVESAVLAGLGSSVGALIPAGILKHIFPGVGEQAAKNYVDLWAKKVPKEILTAGGGMGAMEFFNILAEKHADPKKRDKAFSDEDWARLLNSFAVGVLASGPAVGLTAFKGVAAERSPAEPLPPAETKTVADNVPRREISKEPSEKTPEEPALSPGAISRLFPTDMTPEQRLAMEQVARRDAAGQLTTEDRAYIAAIPPIEKAVYDLSRAATVNQRKSIEASLELQKRQLGNKTTPTLNEAIDDSGEFFLQHPVGTSVEWKFPEGGSATGDVIGYAYGDVGALKVQRKGEEFPDFVSKSQQPINKGEVSNATQIRKEQDRFRLERERANAQLRQEEADRNKPPADQAQGAETSAGDSLQQNARRLESLLGIPEGELDRRKGEPYEDYQARFIATYNAAVKAGQPEPQKAAIALPAPTATEAPPIPTDEARAKAMAAVTGTAEPERVVAATHTEPTGVTTAAESHPAAGEDQGVTLPESRKGRETPDNGFLTSQGRVVDRAEGGAIAEAGGQKVESPAAKPGEPPHSDTIDPLAWLQTVSPKISDRQAMPWIRTQQRGYGFRDLGTSEESKNKTKMLAVFTKPDGSGKVVGTAYDNRGQKVYLGGREGLSWEKAIEKGYQLYGFIHRDVAETRFFREYTNAEWNDIEPHLDNIVGRMRKEAGPLPEVVKPEAGTPVTETGKTTEKLEGDIPRGRLSAAHAERIHNLVDKETGIPGAATAIEDVSDAMATDKTLLSDLAKFGREQTSDLIGKILGLYAKVAAEFEMEGNTSKAQFRARMLTELTGLSARDKQVPPEQPDRKFSVQSNPTRTKTNSEVLPIALHVLMRLAKIGIPVNVMERTTGAIVGSFADSLGRVTGEMSGGMYDRASRMVTWVVNDLTAPTREDLRVLFEEVGHVVFDGELGEVKDPIFASMAKLSDRNFGLDEQQLRDLQAAYPVGAKPLVMAEEAFMAMLSRKLETQGFNPMQSSGIAQALIRLVKELYLKGAMWVQQNLLGRGFDNSDLAERYFENRLRSFLAGDQETLSWISWLGGGKAKYDQQVHWHDPIATSPTLVQKYNALTGQIETAPFPQDSVQSAMLDLQDDLRFSVQAPGAPPAPVIDPSVRLNRVVSVANETLDLHDRIAQDLKVPADVFRGINGIKNPNEIKMLSAAEAARKGIQGYNPDQRIEGFTHEQNYAPMWSNALLTLRNELGKVSKRLVGFKETKEKIEAEHGKIVTEGGSALKQYLDADLTAAQISKDFRALTLQELRQLRVGSRRLGGIIREIQSLQGDLNAPVDSRVVNSLRRLFTGTELQGTTLFDLLDTLANDESINFDWSAAQIRSSIRDRVAGGMVYQPYERLTQDTPESRALLATVIYYGKTRNRIMAQLQMRRMESGEQRAQLEQEIKDLWKETSEQITQGIRRVAYSAKIQDRAKIAFRKILGDAVRAKKNIQRLDEAIKMNEGAIPHYQRQLDVISQKRGFAEDTSFGNGMKVAVPKSTAAGSEFEDFSVQLSATSDNPITDPKKLQEVVDKQSAWLLARENEAKAGSPNSLGLTYGRIKRQRDELVDNLDYQARLRNTDHRNTELIMSSSAKQMEAIGTPSAGLISKALKSFAALNVALRVNAERLFGYVNPRLKRKAIGVLNAGRKSVVDPTWFENEIASPAIGFIGKWVPSEDPSVSVEQSAAQAYAALGTWLLGHDHLKPLIQDRMGQFMPALREMIEARDRAGQWWVEKNEAYGMRVLDPKTGLLRKPHKIGLVTIPQRFSGRFFTMLNGLVGSGWATNGVDEKGAYGEFSKVAELYRNDRQKLESMINRYFRNPVFSDAVQRDFLYSIAHNPDETPFWMPVGSESEAKIPADPASVARAHDESITPRGIDVVGMFERLHQLEGGNGDVADYVQQCLLDLAEQFKAADSTKRKMTGSSDVSVSSLKNIVPNAMIDGRVYTYWPAEWFEYHQFDRNDISRLAERVAGQLTFGRDTERLASLHETLKNEVDGMVADLHTVLNDARKLSPSGKEKEINQQAAKLLAASQSPALQQFKTGEERLAYLRKIEKRSKFVDKMRDDLNLYFKRHNDPSNSLQYGIRIAQELASLLVNQPGSAISQLATMFDIPVQWGASPIMIGRTARTVQLTAKDIAGSLAQAVGVKFLPLSYYEEKFNKLYQDPEAARRAGDIWAVQEGESQNKWARRWRIARDIQSAPVNQLGTEARYTPLRPLAPFFQTVNSTNRALTVSLWEMADRFVAKGVDYLKANPGAEKIGGKELDLGRWDQDGFERWSRDINRYGLKFEDMVKEAKERIDSGDRTLLTDKQLAMLYGLGLNEISLESNIGTMPLSSFNNRILRFVIPLQGWSFRRTMQLLDRRLDEKGQNDLRTVRNALLGLGATMVGGLGLSLVVDAYQEDVLGKRRNIRNLQVPTTGQDWIAINERLARVGTFGMFGDVSNNLLGMGTGQGDNRAFSIDQRVVALQGLQGLLKAANALINQNFDADYKNVVRPAIASVGGNGMLQYMQMVNRAFGLDNLEARTIKRINAENYLRVAGRDLGMQVRGGSGAAAYSTPTPITPWIGRMEYAAFANDPDDFRNAYHGAVEQARKSGHPDDAQEYIRKAFETRHPLRYVFSITPSHNDYLKVLASLSDDGKADVQDAIRLFNHYAGSIGIKPFEGSVKKDQPLNPESIYRARLRAVMGQTTAGGF